MNIKVKKDTSEFSREFTQFTGGEHAIVRMEIVVDPKLCPRTQRALITHAVLEAYCPSWEHPKIEELTELISGALDQLEEVDTRGECLDD